MNSSSDGTRHSINHPVQTQEIHFQTNDILDVSQLTPSGVTSSNLSNYLKVSQEGVFLNEEGNGEFSDETQIATFTDDSLFSSNDIQVKIDGNDPVTVNLDSSVENALAGLAGNDTVVLNHDTELDRIYDFKESEKDTLDISDYMPEGFDLSNLGLYMHVEKDKIYYDVNGEAEFTDSQSIARFGNRSESNRDIEVSFDGQSVRKVVGNRNVYNQDEAFIDEDEAITFDTDYLLAGMTEDKAYNLMNIEVASGEGRIVDNGDGTWTFTPSEHWSGDIRLTLTANNGSQEITSDYAVSVRAIAGEVQVALADNVSMGAEMVDTMESVTSLPGSDSILSNDNAVNANPIIHADDTGNLVFESPTGSNDASDRLQFTASDGEASTQNALAEDVMMDFQTGSGGDVLDLRDLLAEDATLEEALALNFDNGSTTIDVTPNPATGGVTQRITLDGVDLSSYGGASTNTEILNNLIDDGNLQIE